MTPAEVRLSLIGAWRLFVNRPDGLALLDRSVEGFWRSFGALILVLPVDAISLLALSRIAVQPPLAEAFLDRMPALVLDWIAFPIALAFIVKPLGLSGRYVSYVVARNWAAPLSWVILTIPILLQGAGLMGETLAVVATVVALMVVVRYHFIILKLALGATNELAIALLTADLVLSFMIVATVG